MQLTRDIVEAVNAEINSAVSYVSDPEKYHQADWWEDAVEDGKDAGDCEDYAIAKMRRLLSMGVDRASLKLGLCYTELNEYHCVLVATVDGGDIVLDNRYPRAMEWDLLPYWWDRFYLLGDRAWRSAAGS